MPVDDVVLLDGLAEALDAFQGDRFERLDGSRCPRHLRADRTDGIQRIFEGRHDRADGDARQQDDQRKRNRCFGDRQLVDGSGRLGGCRFTGTADLLDDVARQQLVQRFAGVEFREAAHLEDLADGALAIEQVVNLFFFFGDADLFAAAPGLLFPRRAGRLEVDFVDIFAAHDHDVVAAALPAENLIGRADPLLDDRPLVDHASAFHQNRFGADRHDVVAVVLDGRFLRKVVFAVLPAEEPVDDLQNLELQRLLQRIVRDDLVVREDEPESLQRLLLDFERARQLVLGQHSALHQDVAQARFQAVTSGVGTNDFAVQERHGHGVIFAAQRENAGLSLQADQLEDVGQAEVAKGSFKSHRSRCHPSAVNRDRKQEPCYDRGGNREDAYDHFRQFTRREYRRKMPDQNGQADRQEKKEQTDEAGDGPTLEKLRRARQQRREESVPTHHAGLMLSNFLELAPFGRDRNAIALEINVNALRAVGRTFAARFASVAESPS